MKLSYILSDSVHDALKRLREAPLPLKEAFIVKGLVKRVQEELTKFEETRLECLQRYGEKDESGDLKIDDKMQIVITKENQLKFAEEFNDILSLEIEFEKIVLSVDKLDGVALSANDLDILEPLIDFQ